MTESDIYQIIGKAYFDGASHGMSKEASANTLRATRSLLAQAVNKGSGYAMPEGTALRKGVEALEGAAAGFKAQNILRLLGNKSGASQEKAISRVANAIAGKGNSTIFDTAAITDFLKGELNLPGGYKDVWVRDALTRAIAGRAL